MKSRNLAADGPTRPSQRLGEGSLGHGPEPRGQSALGGAGGRILRPGRLDDVVRAVVRLYRREHLTADEARYVHRRVRRALGFRGRPARGKRLPDILTPEELARVLVQAYRQRGVYGLIARTLFETGARVSELVRLEVSDVDFTERTLRVREGKGGRDRLVLFTEDLGQQLRLHLNGRTRGALFESNRHTRFSVRRIQQIVRAVAHAAGVDKPIHPHTYRHSMATFLRNQGVPLNIVQLLLGHADPRTTQLYARLSLSTAREQYDRAMGALAKLKLQPGHHGEIPSTADPAAAREDAT